MWFIGSPAQGYIRYAVQAKKVTLDESTNYSYRLRHPVKGIPGVEFQIELLEQFARKALECPRLVIGDGHLGIWGALRNVYPEAAEQRCWNHKILNVLDKLPKREQAQAKQLLCRIPYSQSRKEAERLSSIFSRWCHERAHQAASEALERDWERMVTFYDFPREHWQHLRTTNPVESPFAALRLRTDAAKRYKRVDRADATRIPTSDSTPTPTPVPDQTEASDATQIPTSDSTPTPTPLPDLVIAIEARLKSNPSIVWGDGCVVSISATLPFHVGEVTARVGNVGGGDAGSFTVQLNNAATETVDGLKAGAYTTVVFSTNARSEHVAVVDAGSSIDESDESNNTAETFIPVPTLVPPAPTCTPSR